MTTGNSFKADARTARRLTPALTDRFLPQAALALVAAAEDAPKGRVRPKGTSASSLL